MPEKTITGLNRRRAHLMAIALFRCNFLYGDLLRWLQGYYTNERRDWASTFDILEDCATHTPPPGYPPIDIPRAKQLCTMGAPLAGDFVSNQASNRARAKAADDRLYAKPSTIPDIEAKFAKEEKMCQHILFPRFVWKFIPGLLITIINWVNPKQHRIGDTGRLALDPSNPVAPYDIGTANSQIPETNTPHRVDENPPVHYGSALMRYLIYLWNLRIDKPNEDILQYADDISGAFRRILMHPDMATIFCTIYKDYMILPVGCIFGARNIPSYYMIIGELRAHLAAYGPFRNMSTDLADSVKLPPPPTPDEAAKIPAAPMDSKNQGIQALIGNRLSSQIPFVDDTANAQTADHIIQAIIDSVLSAYVSYGFDIENAQPCINRIKWQLQAHSILKFLGYISNTRTMTLSWPLVKQQQLKSLLEHTLGFTPTTAPQPPITTTPQQFSNILGLVRNGCMCSSIGDALTLRLQYTLTDALRKPGKADRHNPKWWRYAKLIMPTDVLYDLHLLWTTLDNPRFPNMWTKHIGLIVPRDPTATLYTDAAYEGLGGYCSEHNFMWRCTALDLLALGIHITSFTNMKVTSDQGEHHINVLEFVAIVINMWICLKLLHKQEHQTPGHPTLHILLTKADNTSALGWLKYSARVRSPAVRALASFFKTLLTFANVPFAMQKDHIQHIPGEENVSADALSRPISKGQSWASAMHNAGPILEGLQPYQLPSSLISEIFNCITRQNPGELSEKRMMAIWKIKLRTLPDGWRTATSPMNISPHSKAQSGSQSSAYTSQK